MEEKWKQKSLRKLDDQGEDFCSVFIRGLPLNVDKKDEMLEKCVSNWRGLTPKQKFIIQNACNSAGNNPIDVENCVGFKILNPELKIHIPDLSSIISGIAECESESFKAPNPKVQEEFKEWCYSGIHQNVRVSHWGSLPLPSHKYQIDVEVDDSIMISNRLSKPFKELIKFHTSGDSEDLTSKYQIACQFIDEFSIESRGLYFPPIMWSYENREKLTYLYIAILQIIRYERRVGTFPTATFNEAIKKFLSTLLILVRSSLLYDVDWDCFWRMWNKEHYIPVEITRQLKEVWRPTRDFHRFERFIVKNWDALQERIGSFRSIIENCIGFTHGELTKLRVEISRMLKQHLEKGYVERYPYSIWDGDELKKTENEWYDPVYRRWHSERPMNSPVSAFNHIKRLEYTGGLIFQDCMNVPREIREEIFDEDDQVVALLVKKPLSQEELQGVSLDDLHKLVKIKMIMQLGESAELSVEELDDIAEHDPDEFEELFNKALLRKLTFRLTADPFQFDLVI